MSMATKPVPPWLCATSSSTLVRPPFLASGHAGLEIRRRAHDAIAEPEHHVAGLQTLSAASLRDRPW
jgi:hypothetical protein